MNVQTLRISGMTCDHCAKSIEEALAGMAGVVEAQVSYDEGTARIKTKAGVDSAKLIDAVQGKGFGAEVLDRKGSTVAKGVSDRPRISVVDTPTPSVKPRRRSRGALHVAIIGSGGAAFAAAIRAAEEGASVTLIEKGNARRDLCERRLRALQDHDPRRASRAPAIRSSVRRYQKTSRRPRPLGALGPATGAGGGAAACQVRKHPRIQSTDHVGTRLRALHQGRAASR